MRNKPNETDAPSKMKIESDPVPDEHRSDRKCDSADVDDPLSEPPHAAAGGWAM
jgi:hypothetical protein